jgi:hypothetical protein
MTNGEIYLTNKARADILKPVIPAGFWRESSGAAGFPINTLGNDALVVLKKVQTMPLRGINKCDGVALIKLDINTNDE